MLKQLQRLTKNLQTSSELPLITQKNSQHPFMVFLTTERCQLTLNLDLNLIILVRQIGQDHYDGE